jgi:hypothetical protein
LLLLLLLVKGGLLQAAVDVSAQLGAQAGTCSTPHRKHPLLSEPLSCRRWLCPHVTCRDTLPVLLVWYSGEISSGDCQRCELGQ